MPAQSRPNVVFFFTDQQRWDSSGLHGNPLDLTPNFDRVAMAGTHLAQCITPQPVCGPARSCLQTGMYATSTGVWRNGRDLRTDIPTMAGEFTKAGYYTGCIGKWHLSAADEGPVPADQRGGYQYWLASNVLEFTSDAYRTTVFDNDDRPVNLPGYRVDAVTDAGIRFLDANQKKPFFLFVSYIEPHFQNSRDDYPAPTGYEQRYQARWTPPDLAALPGQPSPHAGLTGGSAQQHLGGYWGMIKRLDEAFGRTLDALKSLRLLDNTIVVFTSDHACHFKTRNSEYKRSCHESSVRVPGLLTGGPFTGGGRIDRPVSLVDFAPTLLDACDIPLPTTMHGNSMLPLLHGRSGDSFPREAFIQISESQTGRAIRTGRWKYSVAAPDVKEKQPGADLYREEFLYDLQSDPYELNNLVGLESHRQLADHLKERLKGRMIQAGEKPPIIENATPRPSGQRVMDEGAMDQ